MNELELRAVCESKRFYDTEFEATRAAACTEHDVRAPIEPYKCPFGNHWHVKNAIKELRGQHERKYIACQDCRAIVKRAKWRKHMKQHGERNRQKAAA